MVFILTYGPNSRLPRWRISIGWVFTDLQYQGWIWNTITYLHFLETGKRWLFLRPASSKRCVILMTYGVWEFGHPCFADEALPLAEAKPFPRLMIAKLTTRNNVWIKIKNISLVDENVLGNTVYEMTAFCSGLQLVILDIGSAKREIAYRAWKLMQGDYVLYGSFTEINGTGPGGQWINRRNWSTLLYKHVCNSNRNIWYKYYPHGIDQSYLQ